MLWGGRWEGSSCLGTHVRIKDFKIKKKRKKKEKKCILKLNCSDPSQKKKINYRRDLRCTLSKKINYKSVILENSLAIRGRKATEFILHPLNQK